MKPFIIGVGLESEKKSSFDCIGTYYDAASPEIFKKALDVVVSQALNTTTVQINLLDASNNPTETNVAMTVYDHYSGDIQYDFMHTMNGYGKPSLLSIDPVGKYDIVVHSIPAQSIRGVELNPGKHNIIAIPAAQGFLNVSFTDLNAASSSGQYLIRRAGEKQTLHVQDINTTNKYIVGNYDIEVLTLPRMIHKNVAIEQGKIRNIKIPREGNLMISAYKSYEASLYQYKGKKIVKIYEHQNLQGKEKLKMLPGKYKFIFRSNELKRSHLTQELVVKIFSGRDTHINL